MKSKNALKKCFAFRGKDRERINTCKIPGFIKTNVLRNLNPRGNSIPLLFIGQDAYGNISILNIMDMKNINEPESTQKGITKSLETDRELLHIK